ncbi:MAG: hypothetical protein Q4E99_02485, partial [Bacillota bacterium]|nr:hypothetical protein [Bacillota bacterium]
IEKLNELQGNIYSEVESYDALEPGCAQQYIDIERDNINEAIGIEGNASLEKRIEYLKTLEDYSKFMPSDWQKDHAAIAEEMEKLANSFTPDEICYNLPDYGIDAKRLESIRNYTEKNISNVKKEEKAPVVKSEDVRSLS